MCFVPPHFEVQHVVGEAEIDEARLRVTSLAELEGHGSPAPDRTSPFANRGTYPSVAMIDQKHKMNHGQAHEEPRDLGFSDA